MNITERNKGLVLFDYGFRPFFLMTAILAVAAIALWLAVLHGVAWPGMAGNMLSWHMREMLFGFVGGAMAGFLLTAIASWTGRAPIQGTLLIVLAATWLAGRLAMAFAGLLNPLLVALLDLSFPVMLAILVAREVLADRNRRNYPVVGLVTLFPLAVGLYHLGGMGIVKGAGEAGIFLGLHLVLLLLVVIAGRIVPSFTANWLRQHKREGVPVSPPRREGLVLVTTVLVGLADTFAQGYVVTGWLALAAAAMHALRLSGWCGLKTISEPLLAVLHLGYAWLVIGYGLLGLAALTGWLPRSAALHALSIGAMGTMILAVMSRAALGHTGRPLHAARPTTVAYLLVSLAALLRIAAAFAGVAYMLFIDASAIAWMAAFVLFIGVYWPILTRPRLR